MTCEECNDSMNGRRRRRKTEKHNPLNKDKEMGNGKWIIGTKKGRNKRGRGWSEAELQNL